MPALVTHYLCGNMVQGLMDEGPLKSIITKYRNVFNLGTQGPDIFFYYGTWPHSKEKGISGLGERMHEEKTGTFILEALNYVSEADEPARSILTAYICGFLCHYLLDCHTHPYIFYKTGFVRKGETHTNKYTCYHRMFETALDILMLKGELGIKPHRFNASLQIRIPAQAAAEIGNMYSKVLNSVYQIDVDNSPICDAIADIANISALLRDRTGIKKLLLANTEKMLGKLPMFSSMILPREIKDGIDYLNASHNPWYFPWDNSSALTSSFTENFEAAAAESKKTIEMIGQYMAGKVDLDSIAPAIGNRSYSTGRDSSLELEFKYFDCIYESPEKKIK